VIKDGLGCCTLKTNYKPLHLERTPESVRNTTRCWLAGIALTAAVIMGVTGIAAGQAGRMSHTHQASYVHHPAHRTAGRLRLTHFMPDTSPSVQLV
jgi:hypothetical protein